MEVSYFAALKTYFLLVTLLAFFLRKAILALSSGVLVLVFLHLASYNSVSIPILIVALPLYISCRGLECSLLLFVSFL